MNSEQKEQNDLYISSSKEIIDKLLYNHKYQDAFNMLIMVIVRLDKDYIYDFIKYYENKTYNKNKLSPNILY